MLYFEWDFIKATVCLYYNFVAKGFRKGKKIKQKKKNKILNKKRKKSNKYSNGQ